MTHPAADAIGARPHPCTVSSRTRHGSRRPNRLSAALAVGGDRPVRGAVDLAPAFRGMSETYPYHGCASLRATRVELSGRSRLLGVADGSECGLDATGEVVNEPRELGDGVQRAVFAPIGDIGDGFAGDVQAEAAEL